MKKWSIKKKIAVGVVAVGVVGAIVLIAISVRWTRGVPSRADYIGYASAAGGPIQGGPGAPVPPGSWVALKVTLDEYVGFKEPAQDYIPLKPTPSDPFVQGSRHTAKETANYITLTVWFHTLDKAAPGPYKVGVKRDTKGNEDMDDRNKAAFSIADPQPTPTPTGG